MRIVLTEMSASLDTLQSTTRLETEVMCDLTNTDWEVFIRMHTVCINHHMMWTVHWTKNERLTLYVHGREHVFLVVIPVTGCLVQIHRTNTWCHNVQVAKLTLLILDVVLQLLPDRIPLRKEHRKSTSNEIVYHEQLHILTDLSVVSLLCLFEKLQMCLQLFCCWEADTVNSLQYLIVVVALPVSA